jgi:tetratricopeptide (TPR) repeat protein
MSDTSGDRGQLEEALKAAAEAVELSWAQVQSSQPQPGSHLYQEYMQECMDLVMSRLGALDTLLMELGRLDEALTAAPEAVEPPRALAQRNPDAVLLGLAGNLQHLADWVGAMQIPDVAMSAAWKAVIFFLAAFQPGSAGRLSNLGSIWNKLGRDEEQGMPVPEAVELLRALAQCNPDAVHPGLADSFTLLMTWLNRLGRREEALKVMVELVELRRALARPYPDFTQFDLASSLVELGIMLFELERHEEALASFQEAIDTLWPFLEHFPEHCWELARDLLSRLQALHSLLERPLPVALQERRAAFARLEQPGRVLLS